ncbi:hypothetical protein TNCV_1112251 [Trichonephila clavipes]|uniref:Uncharacterized protein n=1 Tax=Trichonephila clavipes TaxID=2585209 RepID=A0A8X6V2K4_TRICX|nr:hypothetical protein TNCV_1112251 [Trichonephila clavipes]
MCTNSSVEFPDTQEYEKRCWSDDCPKPEENYSKIRRDRPLEKFNTPETLYSTVVERSGRSTTGKVEWWFATVQRLGYFQTLDRPMSTMRRILRSIQHAYPYKISYV